METYVRAPYGYDREQVSMDTSLRCEDPSRTQQQFKDDADINVLAKRFGLDGKLPEGVHMPMAGDFEGVFDFQSAMDQIVRARESFDAMPAHVRSRFGNDPHAFVQFCSDDKNYEEAEKLGLIRPEVVEKRKADAEAKRKADFEKALEERLEADRRRAAARPAQ